MACAAGCLEVWLISGSGTHAGRLKRRIADLLDWHDIDDHRRQQPGGLLPQAIAVGQWNIGLIIYCIIARDGQKYPNLLAGPRVSIAIGGHSRAVATR